MNRPRIVGIIPSRLKSSRLPNKPLYKIFGIPLIQHVYFRAKMAPILDDLYVATDAEEIVNVVENIGGRAILTSANHKNGTERIAEVAKKIKADYYVLINGDEILLNPASIVLSIEALVNSNADGSILAIPFNKNNSPSDFKLVLNSKCEVMYISRNDIPSAARNPVDYRLKAYHIMTFKPETLEAYSKMDKTPLEMIEDHEHLRLIENGYRIICQVVNDRCISLDTPEDIPLIENYLSEDHIFLTYANKLR